MRCLLSFFRCLRGFLALRVSWIKYNALPFCFNLHSVDKLYSTLSFCVMIRIDLRFGIIPIASFGIQVLWQHLFSVNLPNNQLIFLNIIFDDSISITSLHHIENFVNQCSQFPQIRLVAFFSSLDQSRHIFNL